MEIPDVSLIDGTVLENALNRIATALERIAQLMEVQIEGEIGADLLEAIQDIHNRNEDKERLAHLAAEAGAQGVDIPAPLSRGDLNSE